LLRQRQPPHAKLKSWVAPEVELLVRYGRSDDRWDRLQVDDCCIGRTGLAGRHRDDVVEGTSGQQGSDEVDAAGNRAEVRGEDGLCDPDDERNVEEDIDERSIRADHLDEDVEEVVSIIHLSQSPPLLIPALDDSDRTIHIIISNYNRKIDLPKEEQKSIDLNQKMRYCEDRVRTSLSIANQADIGTPSVESSLSVYTFDLMSGPRASTRQQCYGAQDQQEVFSSSPLPTIAFNSVNS
jgi:hypothetical protein